MDNIEQMSAAQSYRYALLDSLLLLKSNRNCVLNRIFNLAMSGEYSDIDEIFEVGDEIPADVDYVRPCNDVNVQALLKVLDTLDTAYDFLANVNNINEEELEERERDEDELPF